MASNDEKYYSLCKVKEKILKHNLFSSVSQEIADFDEAIDLVLDSETKPVEPKVYNQEISALQIQLNKCEEGKRRALLALDKTDNLRYRRKLFDKKKIGIVGGHNKERKKLKDHLINFSNGASIKFQETSEENVSAHRKFKEKYRNSDVIIAITGYSGHALTNHVGMIESECKTRAIYVKDLSDVNLLTNEIVQILDA